MKLDGIKVLDLSRFLPGPYAAMVLANERLYGGAAFYDIYECRDGGHLVLSGSEIQFAEGLLTHLGRPDLIALCRQPAGPVQRPVHDFLAETFRTRTRDEWERDLAGVNVCFAPVNTLAEGLQLPQLRERGTVLPGPDGTLRFGTPIPFAEEPGRAADRGPELGEHTDAVLAEARGCRSAPPRRHPSPGRLARLVRRGVDCLHWTIRSRPETLKARPNAVKREIDELFPCTSHMDATRSRAGRAGPPPRGQRGRGPAAGAGWRR